MASGFKLLNINNTETHETLFRKGFKYARDCGFETEGLISAIMIGYIDNLIISQAKFTNYKFLEHK
jgi:hypothetical protein